MISKCEQQKDKIVINNFPGLFDTFTLLHFNANYNISICTINKNTTVKEVQKQINAVRSLICRKAQGVRHKFSTVNTKAPHHKDKIKEQTNLHRENSKYFYGIFIILCMCMRYTVHMFVGIINIKEEYFRKHTSIILQYIFPNFDVLSKSNKKARKNSLAQYII